MAGTQYPLSDQQLRLLDAAGVAGRASQLAVRAGVDVAAAYPALARLVSRRLLAKTGAAVPIYSRTDEGTRQLEASKAFRERLQEAS